ncbi:DUF3219 family protein [Lentibacillus sp. N15]|uniref:DUF3219 family protein n=1 Tax=Lentibacillus songyuanensis TaxID=3136161 RepID=UPI0031BA5F80
MDVIINHVSLHTDYVDDCIIRDQTTGGELHKIGFEFKVKSKDYHKITTLLYTNDFQVQVPVKEIEFRATIHSYSTSITNLYEENAVGDFKLELIEKKALV